jgi:hypothetical protein
MTEEQKNQLEEIRQSFLSDNYKIICDETNNTPEDIENGVINITIIPFISVERITVDFELKKND